MIVSSSGPDQAKKQYTTRFNCEVFCIDNYVNCSVKPTPKHKEPELVFIANLIFLHFSHTFHRAAAIVFFFGRVWLGITFLHFGVPVLLTGKINKENVTPHPVGLMLVLNGAGGRAG